MTVLSYAQEVYAACATIGFTEGSAAALKELLDRHVADGATGTDIVSDTDLLRAAQEAHRAAATWASRR